MEADFITPAAQFVFEKMGRGLTENIYRDALCLELQRRGYKVDKEVVLPIMYNGMSAGFMRLDLRVFDANAREIIVELKAQTSISDAHVSQLFAYMKHGQVRHGLLINFEQRDANVKLMLPNRELLFIGSSDLSPCLVQSISCILDQ